MEFVGMQSIKKQLDLIKSSDCSEWVATEKVHGSSFQFFTSDGLNIGVASRNRKLGVDGGFLKCDLKELVGQYGAYVKRVWQMVSTEDKWEAYRAMPTRKDKDIEDEDIDQDGEEEEDEELKGETEEESKSERQDYSQKEEEEGAKSDVLHVRIYGELYGGGGVNTDIKRAVQKEIIYSDDFRFYVFAITINRKWTTNAELNDLCQAAGFPYYAKPVCEPKATLDELKQWLTDTGFMNTRSTLTDRTDDKKTFIEGVVMTPLTRKDFRLHVVKLLANTFTDVRMVKDKKGKIIRNYCTKARYHSVISKLDIPEREQTDMVADLFVEDIIKEATDMEITDKLKGIWRNLAIQWLKEDGYHSNTQKTKKEEADALGASDANDDEEAFGFADMFS